MGLGCLANATRNVPYGHIHYHSRGTNIRARAPSTPFRTCTVRESVCVGVCVCGWPSSHNMSCHAAQDVVQW